MTNKEKCDFIKHFYDQKDVVGILGSFLIDDAYKDVEFAKYMKNSYPELFFGIHPIILEELEKEKEAAKSCAALLANDKISKQTKAEIAQKGNTLVEKIQAIIGAAKALCITFSKANE